MASLPSSTIAGGVRTFAVPEGGRGLVTITRLSDGALIRAFCPAPLVQSPTAPLITSIEPARAAVGDTVTIRGLRLGDVLHAIYFGTAPISEAETAHTATSITCKVPAGATSAGVQVQTNSTGNSNIFPFTIGNVTPTGPTITSIVPNAAKAGDTVTVYGTNLGAALGSLYFGAAAIQQPVTNQSSTQFTTVVPVGATSDGVQFTTTGGVKSNLFSYAIKVAGWQKVTLLGQAGSFFDDGQRNYYTSATDQGWGNNALTNLTAPNSASGSVRFRYVRGQSERGVITLHDTQVLVAQPDARFSVYIDPATFHIIVAYKMPGGVPVGVDTGVVAIDGYYYTLTSTYGHVYVQQSPDGLAYTPAYDFPASTNTAQTLYFGLDINGGVAFHILQPEYSYA